MSTVGSTYQRYLLLWPLWMYLASIATFNIYTCA